MHESFLPKLVCPLCHGALCCEARERDALAAALIVSGELRCESCDALFSIETGIPRLLQRTPERDAWLLQYDALRRREGWHSEDPAFYRALPFEDRSGRNKAAWAVRAKSFQCLLAKIQAQCGEKPLDALDLGAGTGWLAARLAAKGHRVLALDLDAGATGLQAARHIRSDGEDFGLVQAALEQLPVARNSIDLVVFNASFHYVQNRLDVLQRVQSLLRANGVLAIVDSPTYPTVRDRELAEERSLRYYQAQGHALLSTRYHGLVFSEMMQALSSLFADVSYEYTHTPSLQQKVLGYLRGAPASFVLFWARGRMVKHFSR